MDETYEQYQTYERKVLVCHCYGLFGFSEAFASEMRRTDPECVLSRDNPHVVDAAVKFGLGKASGQYCNLVVETIPAYMNYKIEEYDGLEHIVLEFPWKQFARALYYEDETEPILIAVRSGEVALPYE